MYEAFYGLKERPFSIQPDPEFLFLGRRHAMAYAMLEYGVTHRAAFSVICGDIGCGKTTLIRHLLNALGAELTVGMVHNTHREITSLLEWIMLAFGQPYRDLSPVALYDAFQRYLATEYGAGRRLLLIVDEAQNLSIDALESLRMLSNINAGKDPLLQIVLVGQPQLGKMLRQPGMQQFTQRVSAQFFIPPLAASEVEPYIQHRVKVAGRQAPLFTRQACERLSVASGGTPRSINILCDTALVYGFSIGNPVINREVVEEVLQDRCEYGI